MPDNILAIFFDLGDTIMAEESEIKDAGGTTLSAGLIPGMAEALHRLHSQGHRLALVADSRPETPLNVLGQHGLLGLFEHLSISENVGVEKPDPVIFQHALDAMGFLEGDYPHIVMVGNNLERDIAGANRLGLRSVFIHTNEHRRTIAQNRAEIPRHTVTNARELLNLFDALSHEVTGSQVPTYQESDDGLALASRYAPWIFFDENEPFLPLVVGCTIFRTEEQSPSFLRRIQHGWRPGWKTAIEYALWWDWDIGHLYELEHVWSYIDDAGGLVWVEASSHGAYASMLREDRTIPHEGTHPVVYSQPGKHAFSPTPHWFEMFRDMVDSSADFRAGSGGVLVKPEYARLVAKTPAADAKAAAWLRQKAFQPTLKFTKLFKVTPELLVPWPTLDLWIPERVNWWLSKV